MLHYVLDEQGEPRAEPDLITWTKWYSTDERRVVRRNTFELHGSEVTVSTVFLGLDHSFDDGPPVLWETMLFGPPPWDEQMWRYTSREAAIAQHDQIVEHVRDGKLPEESW